MNCTIRVAKTKVLIRSAPLFSHNMQKAGFSRWLICSEFLPVYVSAETMEKYGLTTPSLTTSRDEAYSYDPTVEPSIMSPFAIGFR